MTSEHLAGCSLRRRPDEREPAAYLPETFGNFVGLDYDHIRETSNELDELPRSRALADVVNGATRLMVSGTRICPVSVSTGAAAYCARARPPGHALTGSGQAAHGVVDR